MARSEVVDFTMAFHQEPASTLIPPPTSGEKLTVLVRPLSPQVKNKNRKVKFSR